MKANLHSPLLVFFLAFAQWLHQQLKRLRITCMSKSSISSTIDTNRVLAWQKGILQLEGQSFANIAATLKIEYGVNFVRSNPALRNCRYSPYSKACE